MAHICIPAAFIIVLLVGCGADESVRPFTGEMTDQDLVSRTAEINRILASAIKSMEDQDYTKAERELRKIQPVKHRLGNWSEVIDEMLHEIAAAKGETR